MRRVLFLNHSSSIGGGSYCMLNVLRELDRSTFEAIVVLNSKGSLSDEIGKLGIKVLFLPKVCDIPYSTTPILNRYSIAHIINCISSLKPFKELLIRERIDIVYLNSIALAAYLIPAKKAGCKTVLHIREHWDHGKNRFKLKLYTRWVDNYCDRLLAINKHSASIFPQKKSIIVYDWIDMSKRYKNMPLDEIFGEDCTQKKVILYTGGTQPIKGADYVVEVFTKYVKGDEYRLLMLGATNFGLTGKLKKRLKTLLGKLGFRFKGSEILKMIQDDKRIKCIPAVYEISHLVEQSCCFVSYFRKPHANLALVENIILKNACIAADNEEAQEYTSKGEYAKLVTPNDIKLFAKELNDFLIHIERWQKAAENGAKTISQIFDKERNAVKINETFHSLV